MTRSLLSAHAKRALNGGFDVVYTTGTRLHLTADANDIRGRTLCGSRNFWPHHFTRDEARTAGLLCLLCERNAAA